MDVSAPTTAAQWASTVSPARYKKHRDEFDSLLIASVPGYREKVAVTFEGFVRKVRDAQSEYDAEHDVARLQQPLTPTWFTSTLWWISVLGGIVAFALMVARGGPSVTISDADWNIRALLASVAFAAGVCAQLLRVWPLRRSVPPRRDVAFISTVFGAIALGIMMALITIGVAVSPVWAVITGGALAASTAYAIPYVMARRRDPELTSRVDSIEEDRLTAAGDRLEDLADDCADALEADFGALTAADRKAVNAELAAATRVLRERGIIRTPTAAGMNYIRLRATRDIRPFFPGFLLLEKLVQQVWNPAFSEPRTRLRVRWSTTEYGPK